MNKSKSGYKKINVDELKELVARAKLNGALRGAPDEPCPRLLAAVVMALEKMEKENPGILAKKPPLAMLIAEIAGPVRWAVQRMADGHRLGDIAAARQASAPQAAP
jgi:hypothetical protein